MKVREEMEEGFWWYSWVVFCGEGQSGERGGEGGGATNLEVSEEGVHEQVEDDKRRENGVDDAHQDEAASQPVSLVPHQQEIRK